MRFWVQKVAVLYINLVYRKREHFCYKIQIEIYYSFVIFSPTLVDKWQNVPFQCVGASEKLQVPETIQTFAAIVCDIFRYVDRVTILRHTITVHWFKHEEARHNIMIIIYQITKWCIVITKLYISVN